MPVGTPIIPGHVRPSLMVCPIDPTKKPVPTSNEAANRTFPFLVEMGIAVAIRAHNNPRTIARTTTILMNTTKA